MCIGMLAAAASWASGNAPADANTLIMFIDHAKRRFKDVESAMRNDLLIAYDAKTPSTALTI